MKRWGWWIAAAVLVWGSVTAFEIYPSQKWWMRAGYVKLWQASNWIRGDDLPVHDRFK